MAATITSRELAQMGWRVTRTGKAVEIVATEPRKPREKIDNVYDSKLERDYATYLSYLHRDGSVVLFEHHPACIGVTKVNRYKPDFLVAYKDHFEWVEVKGVIREDDVLKCQLVSEFNPRIKVVMVRRVKNRWVRREF
jgi:hypothetical protein